MSINSEQERARLERERGWIIFMLYHARLRSLDITSLRSLLDARNYPVSSRRLADHVSHLCDLRLVKVELPGRRGELSEQEQTRALQRYAEADTDGFPEALHVRLTAAGTNFQEGFGQTYDGIARVE